MAGSARPRPLAPVRPDAEVDYEDLPDFCANPSCREEFRRSSGPGRPQAYCKEGCRREAERDLRRLFARKRRFENVLTQVEADIATYVRTSEGAEDQLHSRRAVELAVKQAETVARYASADDPRVLDELRQLLVRITPVVFPAGSSTVD